MPYISTEAVAIIRNTLKTEFPDIKFSVRKEHHSSIYVTIVSAPLNLMPIDATRDYAQISQYHFKEHYKEGTEEYTIMSRILEIIFKNYRIVSEDGDYGSIPNYYGHLSVGEWEKPLIITEAKKIQQAAPEAPKTTKTVQPIEAGKIQVIQYSEKSIAVIGDTYPIRATLRELGGKFNKFLTCGAGWIFPLTSLENLQKGLNLKAADEPKPQSMELVSINHYKAA